MSETYTHMHWAFVVAAYAVTVFGLGGLTVWTLTRLRYWKQRAGAAEQSDA